MKRLYQFLLLALTLGVFAPAVAVSLVAANIPPINVAPIQPPPPIRTTPINQPGSMGTNPITGHASMVGSGSTALAGRNKATVQRVRRQVRQQRVRTIRRLRQRVRVLRQKLRAARTH